MVVVNSSPTHRRILIIVEKEGDKVTPITFELLEVGRKLAEKIYGNLCVAVLGHKVDKVAIEIVHYSDEIYSLDSALLEEFQVDLYAHALEKLCRNINPDILLMGHTLNNLELAPKLACKLGTKLITDCIDLDIEQERECLLCMKPIYGDKAIGTFILEKKPQMVTIRPKAIENRKRSSKKGKMINFEPDINVSLAKTELIEKISGESVSLDKADAIVAGGRGIKRVEGLKDLEELIDILKKFFPKVELGASRPLVDTGWLPHSRQLGSTGEKARPQLYIAIGISGASQHLSGIFGSKIIVAINRDEQAPIFNSADYGAVGEYEHILPAFIKKLKDPS